MFLNIYLSGAKFERRGTKQTDTYAVSVIILQTHRVSLYRVPEGGSFIAYEAFVQGYFRDHFTIHLKLFHGRTSRFCNA